MAPKPDDVLLQLNSTDSELKLHAVRCLKNEIIGSQNKKLFYVELGVVPRIVQLLATQQEKKITIQAAATLGSFAYGNPEGVKAVVESGGLAHLLKSLSNKEEKVLEASVRSLKMIFQSLRSPRDSIFVHPAFERLVSLLKHPKKTFAEDVACILARCCRTKAHQEALLNAGALDGIMSLLASTVRNSHAAALDALVSLSKDNRFVCETLMSTSEMEELLLSFTRDSSTQFRFLASSILTHINCSMTSNSVSPLSFRKQKHILQVLVKLLKENLVNQKVAEVLATLTEGRVDLQRAAYEADAAKTLCTCLKNQDSMDDRLRHGTLRALGTICRDLDECRSQVIQSQTISVIVNCLESKSSKVKASAAFCIQNMTRSIKDLNNDWLHSSILPLLTLLRDDDTDVKIMACGALCNLCMSSTCMEMICTPETLGLLVELTQSENSALTYNAAWAFKNLSCGLPIKEKRMILKELPWLYVKRLIYDPNHEIQESVLSFLQNMCKNTSESITESVLAWSNDELLAVITDKLERIMENHPEVVVAALRVANNVSTGLAEHLASVMSCGIPSKLISCLRDERSDHVRSAAVWCVINLTWREDHQSKDSQDDVHQRTAALRDLGIEAELKQMQTDESLDVRERVKTALSSFQRLDF